jgi:hypothetical protein
MEDIMEKSDEWLARFEAWIQDPDHQATFMVSLLIGMCLVVLVIAWLNSGR